MPDFSIFLSKTPLFQSIPAESIPTVMKTLKAFVKTYEKGDYIRHTGDAADFIGIILEGNIQIFQDDYDGKRTITATVRKGELFAEAFACAGISALPVDIISVENSTIMFIYVKHIFNACSTSCEFHHALIGNLLRIVSRKNMILNQKLQYMSHKTTGEKLLAYLNDQARLNHSSEFTIPFNRQELADYLGVERSAMSAEIGKLVKAGMIETKRSHFKIYF